MQSWRLKDDLDLEDFGGSWLAHPSNAEFLEHAEQALLQRIQGNTELQAIFLAEAADVSLRLNPKAIALYEKQAQEFLKRLLVLCHILAGQPLREPELLSITWRSS
jgi:hypothetical protein